MNCPYCNDDMEHGYIEGGETEMNWKPNKTGPLTFENAKFHKGAVVLSPCSMKTLFSKNRVEAYICKKCKKIIISYE